MKLLRLQSAVLILLSLFAVAQNTPYDQAIKSGEDALRAGKTEDAIRAYKKANKLKNDQSYEAWMGLARAYSHTRFGSESSEMVRKAVPLSARDVLVVVTAYKDSIEAARKAVPLASNNLERAWAHYFAGVSLEKLATLDRQNKLPEAEKEFRVALELSPEHAISRYALGRVLMAQGKREEGAAELKKFLDTNPSPELRRSAESLMPRPGGTRGIGIPEFSLTSLDGRYVEYSDFKNKVLVISFCTPSSEQCLRGVNEMRRLAREFRTEPVAFLSIWMATDDAKVREIVAKKHADWTNACDKDGSLSRSFGVGGYPTYMVINDQGRRDLMVVGHAIISTPDDNRLAARVSKSVKELANTK